MALRSKGFSGPGEHGARKEEVFDDLRRQDHVELPQQILWERLIDVVIQELERRERPPSSIDATRGEVNSGHVEAGRGHPARDGAVAASDVQNPSSGNLLEGMQERRDQVAVIR